MLLVLIGVVASPSTAWANVPPVVEFLETSAPSVAPGGVVTLSVRAHDPDCATGACTGGCGAYLRADLTAWSATSGTLGTPDNGISASPYAAAVDWQAPTAEGTYAIDVTLADSGTFLCGGRLSVTATVEVLVTASTNRPPVVSAVSALPTQLLPGQVAALTCVASDADGDPIFYSWTTDRGAVNGVGASATFVGSQPGVATVTCTATDSRRFSGSGTARVSVTEALAESRLTRDLSAPQRVAVDSIGDVYVADPGRGGLAVLNLADGELVYRIPFAGVTSVAVDWQDRLLVGGSSGASVLDRRGNEGLVLVAPEPLGAVADVAVDAARRRYAVLHGETSRILVYDEAGAPITAIGVAGDGASELRRPQGVAFTPEGDLVVADSGQATVKVFDLDGTLSVSFGGNGTSAGQFVRLDDVEVGADGVIYASDAYQAWVQAFNPDGTLREVIGTYGGGLGRFRTPSGIAAAASYRKLIVASTNTPSLEIFRMTGDPVPPRRPQPVLSTASLSFPGTAVGTASATQVATLSNAGAAPLGIRRVIVSGEFSQSNDCGLALDPGQTCSFRVTYLPLAPGEAAGSLGIETSARPGNVAVALAGHGFWGSTARLVPDVLAFADQRVGTTSTPLPVTLSNTGGGTLLIGSISAGPDFGIVHGCGGELHLGGACTMEVSFTPRSAGPASGTLAVETNAVNGPLAATLSGVGVPPGLQAQPPTLDFGSRPTRVRSGPRTVTVTNLGTEPLGVSATLVAGADSTEFLITDDACEGATLAVGASCTVGVLFRPTGTGPFTSSVRFVLDAGDAHDLVALTGVGVPPDRRELIFADDFESDSLSTWTVRVPREAIVRLGPAEAPPPVAMGQSRVGAPLWLTVRVVNRLAGPVEVASVTLEGVQADSFQMGDDLCSRRPVPAGQSCTVRVGFVPLAAGSATAEVTIVSSAGRSRLTLTGEGQAGAVPRRRRSGR